MIDDDNDEEDEDDELGIGDWEYGDTGVLSIIWMVFDLAVMLRAAESTSRS